MDERTQLLRTTPNKGRSEEHTLGTVGSWYGFTVTERAKPVVAGLLEADCRKRTVSRETRSTIAKKSQRNPSYWVISVHLRSSSRARYQSGPSSAHLLA